MMLFLLLSSNGDHHASDGNSLVTTSQVAHVNLNTWC